MQDVWDTVGMVQSQRAITIWSTIWWYFRILSLKLKSFVFVGNSSWKSKWEMEYCFLWVSWEIKAFEVYSALVMWVELKSWGGSTGCLQISNYNACIMRFLATQGSWSRSHLEPLWLLLWSVENPHHTVLETTFWLKTKSGPEATCFAIFWWVETVQVLIFSAVVHSW